jgi:hypothetical protein
VVLEVVLSGERQVDPNVWTTERRI